MLASPLPLPIFTPCRHLIVLELQNNELAEPVFCERDPLQDAFPALRELDLSINAIDDLSALESLLAHRSAQWLGLPKTVPQRAPLTAAGGLRAKLTGNPLRNEAARRRAAKTAALSKPTPVRTVQAVTPTSPLSAMRSMSIEEVKPVSSDAEDVVEAHEQTVNGRATADEAQSVLAGAMDAAGAVSLVGRGLNELPMDLATTATTISSIDASRNALTVLPLGELAACTWSSTLRRLSFSRNRIAALTLSSASVQLPSLVELDLSSNRLSDSDLLHGIATTCPALENLDLTFNSLTALTGVAALLMPSRGRGLRSLKLGSNQLADLSALIEVALRVRGAEGGAWACDELDLRDNAIAKVASL